MEAPADPLSDLQEDEEEEDGVEEGGSSREGGKNIVETTGLNCKFCKNKYLKQSVLPGQSRPDFCFFLQT